ncbi:hypothetical protein BZL30_6668 [Mycobacterium kansasii]|uniref:Uncharacterized protein n=1 Tax=Mycobacterium kansasii TaxID=1768 RepID=A0A1V3WU00_MYCKA|nr:hypothetical protein BZL30_6668 [Mycobacterium kansasii]
MRWPATATWPASITDAALLLVDVLMAYVPVGADAHRGQDIRRVFSRLASLAERPAGPSLYCGIGTKARGARSADKGMCDRLA